jgi:hypothetical protein
MRSHQETDLNVFNVLVDERAAMGRFPREFPKSKMYFSTTPLT